MGASAERIRASMGVNPTPREKGLTLTLKLTAYDNGMVELDGIPINNKANGYDQVEGFCWSLGVITDTVNEFYKQVKRRRKSLATQETD